MLENKPVKNKTKSALEKFRMPYEDSRDEFRVSPSFGRKPAWYVRATNRTISAVVGFFVDLLTAAKVIVRKVL